MAKDMATRLASQLLDTDANKKSLLHFEASDGWKAKFLKRSNGQLTARRPQLFRAHRAKACSEDALRAWVPYYMGFLRELDLKSGGPGLVENVMAEQICNLDESGFCSNPNSVGRVLAPAGMKECQTIGSEHGTHVTAVYAIKANGTISSPFLVIPGQRVMSKEVEADGSLKYRSAWEAPTS